MTIREDLNLPEGVKTCQLCGDHSYYRHGMIAPWTTSTLIYFCTRCWVSLKAEFQDSAEDEIARIELRHEGREDCYGD